MIIKETIGAYAEVTNELLAYDRKGVLESLGTTLARKVIAEGENSGIMIREQSIRVKQLRRQAEQPECVAFSATWYPDPKDGCLFIGGPKDGLQFPIPAEDAPSLIIFPRETKDPVGMISDEQYPQLSTNDEYTLAGRDSERDCWVYEYVA